MDQPLLHTGALGLAIVIIAGLDAPTGALTLALLAYNHWLLPRPDFAPFFNGWIVLACATLIVLQVLANLYFVPARVRDPQYLAPSRTAFAHIHARFQSLVRPLAAAVLLAALPSGLPVQEVAVAGFVAATAVYWFSAWVREYVAIGRGTLVLMLVETIKHLCLLLALLLIVWSPLAALGWLAVLLVPIASWTYGLQRENIVQEMVGGLSVADDS